MAHIKHSRQIEFCSNLTVSQLFPPDIISGNFAVLCGETQLRHAVALQAIRQYAGKCGIVFVHNDPVMSMKLDDLTDEYRNVNFYYIDQASVHGKHYDPLYGLSEHAILDIIIPNQSAISKSLDASSIKARLRDYLSIMRYEFTQNPLSFGEYPFNLSLLRALTHMPFLTLKKEVLDSLPSDLSEYLAARLSADMVQQSVDDAVQNFCSFAEEFFWTPTRVSEHSKLSIISAVKDRNIISIKATNSNPYLLDYIDYELEALIKENVPFLLVESGLELSNSSKFSARFLGEHTQLNYRTGIVSQSLSALTDITADKFSCLTSQYQEIVVLRCSSNTDAEPFSAAAGTYFRRVVTTNTQTHRQPLSFLRSRGNGVQVAEQEERNVRPDELVGLANGAMLCGTNHNLPIMVDKISL